MQKQPELICGTLFGSASLLKELLLIASAKGRSGISFGPDYLYAGNNDATIIGSTKTKNAQPTTTTHHRSFEVSGRDCFLKWNPNIEEENRNITIEFCESDLKIHLTRMSKKLKCSMSLFVSYDGPAAIYYLMFGDGTKENEGGGSISVVVSQPENIILPAHLSDYSEVIPNKLFTRLAVSDLYQGLGRIFQKKDIINIELHKTEEEGEDNGIIFSNGNITKPFDVTHSSFNVATFNIPFQALLLILHSSLTSNNVIDFYWEEGKYLSLLLNHAIGGKIVYYIYPSDYY